MLGPQTTTRAVMTNGSGPDWGWLQQRDRICQGPNWHFPNRSSVDREI